MYDRDVFGEYYLTRAGADLAAAELSSANPDRKFTVRYDCVEQLYRVSEKIVVRRSFDFSDTPY